MPTFQDIDPATGETIADIETTPLDDLHAKVRAARDAQAAWADVPFVERRALLLAGSERLDARADEVAELVTREMGKLKADAVREIFGVRVTKVNTLNRNGKRKRNRRTGTWGQRPDQKRAIVTLAEGDSIDLFEA